MDMSPSGSDHEFPSPEPVKRPILLGAAFIGLVCGFIGIFIGLSIGGLRELRNTSALRADPLGAEVIHPGLQAPGSPVVLLGDSRVNQWLPLPEIAGEPATAIGVPGLTASQLAGALSLNSTRLDGRTIIVQIGINDIKSIGYSDRRQDEILESTRDAIASIHRELAESGARVLVMTILPPGPVPFSRRFIWTDRINQSVGVLNDELVEGAIIPSTAVLDVRGLLGDSEGIDPKFANDTLYVNAEAYEALSGAVVEAVRIGTPEANQSSAGEASSATSSTDG